MRSSLKGLIFCLRTVVCQASRNLRKDKTLALLNLTLESDQRIVSDRFLLCSPQSSGRLPAVEVWLSMYGPSCLTIVVHAELHDNDVYVLCVYHIMILRNLNISILENYDIKIL